MNVYAWIGLLVGAIAGCSGPTAAPHDLQGLWSSDARTKGGLGSQWFFTDNGGVTNTFGALVDFTYKVEGSLIKTTFREEGQPPQETAEEFVLASNTLTLNPADDKKKQIMMRIGADGVRTLSQRVRSNPILVTKRVAERIHRTKKQFERVRIPLAKLEPARAHAATDYDGALPMLHHLGISWKVADRVLIPRQRVSDRLLTLLQAISKSD